MAFQPVLERHAPTSLAIYNGAGRLVRMLWQAEMKRKGDRAEWDGRGDDGSPLPNGDYTYQALQLPTGGVRPRYIATVGNGKGGDPENLGGVVGMIPFDVKSDAAGNIYMAGTGHGRSLQKFDRNGDKVWISKRPDPGRLDDQVSAIAVGSDYVYVAGPMNLWRVDIVNGEAAAWPN